MRKWCYVARSVFLLLPVCWEPRAIANNLSRTACSPTELDRPRLAGWPWRKILADAGLLAAFALASSLLIHG